MLALAVHTASTTAHGDCKCCQLPFVHLNAIDPTGAAWRIESTKGRADAGHSTATFEVYRGKAADVDEPVE